MGRATKVPLMMRVSLIPTFEVILFVSEKKLLEIHIYILYSVASCIVYLLCYIFYINKFLSFMLHFSQCST